MGDMADYTLDFIDFNNKKDRKIQCRYCFKRGLEWVQTDKGFRLFDKNNEIHIGLTKKQTKGALGLLK